MTEEIKTNLIDTPDEVEVDYWTGEWINGDDIIKNLVDESVVLTIANKTIRDRMLSISESAKAIKNTNKELRDKIYKLENENRELQTKVNDIDKLARQKAEEILKDIEREKYGYAMGDVLYEVVERHHYEQEICPVCKGEKKYTINGVEIDCNYCDCKGNHSFMVKDPYTIREVVVEHNTVVLEYIDGEYKFSCNGKVAYHYTNEKKERYFGYINQYTKIFKTKDEAEQYIKEQEAVNSPEFKGEK